MPSKKTRPKSASPPAPGYDAMLSGVAGLLEEARRTSARAVNAIMTATYWEIGGGSWSLNRVARIAPAMERDCSSVCPTTLLQGSDEVFPGRFCSVAGCLPLLPPAEILLDTVGQIGAYGTG